MKNTLSLNRQVDENKIIAFANNKIKQVISENEINLLQENEPKVNSGWPHEKKIGDEEINYITITDNKTKHIVPFNIIIRLEARRAYTIVVRLNKKTLYCSTNIGTLFRKLCRDERFFLTHKSHIVNMRFVNTCTRRKRCSRILMADERFVEVSAKKRKLFENAYQQFCIKHSIQRIK